MLYYANQEDLHKVIQTYNQKHFYPIQEKERMIADE